MGLRAYGQRDPLVEYKREAFDMFEVLMESIKQDVATAVFRSTTSTDSYQTFMNTVSQTLVHEDVSLLGGGAAAIAAAMSETDAPAEGDGERRPSGPDVTVRRNDEKIGRNDPCPCGSGKKHKRCCGT